MVSSAGGSGAAAEAGPALLALPPNAALARRTTGTRTRFEPALARPHVADLVLARTRAEDAGAATAVVGSTALAAAAGDTGPGALPGVAGLAQTAARVAADLELAGAHPDIALLVGAGARTVANPATAVGVAAALARAVRRTRPVAGSIHTGFALVAAQAIAQNEGALTEPVLAALVEPAARTAAHPATAVGVATALVLTIDDAGLALAVDAALACRAAGVVAQHARALADELRAADLVRSARAALERGAAAAGRRAALRAHPLARERCAADLIGVAHLTLGAAAPAALLVLAGALEVAPTRAVGAAVAAEQRSATAVAGLAALCRQIFTRLGLAAAPAVTHRHG